MESDNLNNFPKVNDSPPETHLIKNRNRNLLLFLGVIFIIIAVGIGAYFIGLNKNSSDNSRNNKVIMKPIDEKSENVTSSTNKIAYMFNGDLWTVNPDTYEEKQLTQYGYNKSPVWSPDARRIAYMSSPESVVKKGIAECTNYHNIWVINSDGTEPVQVTNSEASRSKPRWSPDSNRIVFIENEKVIVYDLASNKKRTLAHNAYYDEDPNQCRIGGGGGVSNVSWNPRDNTILYNPQFGFESKAELISAEDGKVIKTVDRFGQWSPDGTKIAYVEYSTDQPTTHTIVVLTIADGKKEMYQPFMDRAYDLHWSPDGAELLYHSFEESAFGPPPLKMYTVHVLNLATKADRNVSDKVLRQFIEQRKDSGMQVGGSSAYGWSPDGKHIVVDVSTEEHRPEYAGVNQINIVDAKTGDFIRTLKEARRTTSNLGEGNGYFTGIVWSPK